MAELKSTQRELAERDVDLARQLACVPEALVQEKSRFDAALRTRSSEKEALLTVLKSTQREAERDVDLARQLACVAEALVEEKSRFDAALRTKSSEQEALLAELHQLRGLYGVAKSELAERDKGALPRVDSGPSTAGMSEATLKALVATLAQQKHSAITSSRLKFSTTKCAKWSTPTNKPSTSTRQTRRSRRPKRRRSPRPKPRLSASATQIRPAAPPDQSPQNCELRHGEEE